MTCLSAAQWHTGLARTPPGIAVLGTVNGCILFCGGQLLLALLGFGAGLLFSYLQYLEKRTPTWTAVCMDYQSATLLVLANFHFYCTMYYLRHFARCGRKDAEIWGRVSCSKSVFPSLVDWGLKGKVQQLIRTGNNSVSRAEWANAGQVISSGMVWCRRLVFCRNFWT